ncbi:MAG: uridine diphosphate-N-acetylglucosamine-binding protein YvcK [Actinobacteria bacterium]|nr:uridine diphosphate-N-acetylglucosamine-binding protein YvcK [Actinomycetota bacterium]
MSRPKVVALGGGHGLAATLSALRKITHDLTAIVTVADNGGSSGRLRREFNSLPPGDLRMALAALCSDDEWGRSWAEIMQYRFTSEGDLNGHALGNLLLTALWDSDSDPVKGLERVGALLKVVGRVLPMALEPLDIEGVFKTWQGTHLIKGQQEVAIGKGALEDLRLIPENPTPTSQGLDAIAQADFITLGPGSWFSSVLPHLLVVKQRQALDSSAARKVIILNLDASPNAAGDELAGSSPADHLRILRRFSPNLSCDIALLDSSIAARSELLVELEGLVEAMGGRVFVADLASHPGSNHHDTEKLFLTLSHIFQAEMLR